MKAPAPFFEYLLYHPGNPVEPGSSPWQAPLPMNRQGRPANPENDFVTIGGYFREARALLEKDGCRPLVEALSRHTQRQIRPEEIEGIRICLSKHGEFYHPARVEALVSGTSYFLVLNVAVSEAGKHCAKGEVRLLSRLKEEFPYRYVPQVYFRGGWGRQGATRMEMFLGEWFEDFHEFHLSRDPSDGRIKVQVWDGGRGFFYLSPDQCRALYGKAAEILTGYYRLDTFEQIFPWHHAAGDFVLRCHGPGNPELRLVTVRQYAPMVGGASSDPDAVLQALLIFFLNLSIRMRLDRLDGVGDIAWAEGDVVPGTLQGFLSGLCRNPTATFLPEPPEAFFLDFLSQSDKSELLDLASSIVDACDPASFEIPIIRRHLDRHIAEMIRAVHGLRQGPRSRHDERGCLLPIPKDRFTSS